MVFSETVLGRAVRLVRSGTHLHAIEPLRKMLAETLPAEDFADLKVPFHCVAASIEDATAHWFASGPLVPAVMASCAVPGLLPPVEIDGRHYFDGGLVHSIPVGRAIALGASTVYVLHVGTDREPAPGADAAVGGGPGRVRDRAQAPVPRGDGGDSGRASGCTCCRRAATRLQPGLGQFRYRSRIKVSNSIDRAYAASASYLGPAGRLPLTDPRRRRCFRRRWYAALRWCRSSS